MQDRGFDTGYIMRQVIFALLLGVLASLYFFGWTGLIQIILGALSALLFEALFLKLRKRPIWPSISDGSAILTGILLAISIPTIAPWWIVVLGVGFAIVFGKQLYGGLGNNPFNPAMLGYAFLLISYPLQMVTWQSTETLSLSQSLNVIFNYTTFDGISSATILDSVKTQISLGQDANAIDLSHSAQWWINIGFLLGGLYLLFKRIIFWHIPLSFLIGVVAMSSILYVIDNTQYTSPIFHLTTGATMLGAFFIATDPVSSSTTPKGRLLYGFLIGLLIVLIRTFGSYPDGVAFAVLLINIAVPLIDYYTQPKVFGRS